MFGRRRELRGTEKKGCDFEGGWDIQEMKGEICLLVCSKVDLVMRIAWE